MPRAAWGTSRCMQARRGGGQVRVRVHPHPHSKPDPDPDPNPDPHANPNPDYPLIGTFTTPRRNRIACWFFLDMFGISSFMYQRVHTFGHHLHTNERGADPDIEVRTPSP